MVIAQENWLSKVIDKEAARRFRPGDKVRFYTTPHKGTGDGHVLTPVFARGVVQNYDPTTRRYIITNVDGEEVSMHPKNMAYDTVSRK